MAMTCLVNNQLWFFCHVSFTNYASHLRPWVGPKCNFHKDHMAQGLSIPNKIKHKTIHQNGKKIHINLLLNKTNKNMDFTIYNSLMAFINILTRCACLKVLFVVVIYLFIFNYIYIYDYQVAWFKTFLF